MAVASGSNDSTSSVIIPGVVGPVPALSPNLRWEDMNTSTGGINRGTTIGSSFVTVYDVSGSGLFFGFRLHLDDLTDSPPEEWFIRLIIDGSDILQDSGGIPTEDIVESDVYDYDNSDDNPFQLGIKVFDDTITFMMPYPIAYASTIEIQVRCPTTDQFEAGLALRTIN